MYIPNILQNICSYLDSCGAKSILVGGTVRDYLLGDRVKDFDIEVYNISTLNELEELLGKFGNLNSVGKVCGVVKLNTDDFSLTFHCQELKKS